VAGNAQGQRRASDHKSISWDEGDPRTALSPLLRELFYPELVGQREWEVVNEQSVGLRLKRHLGDPVRQGGRTLVMRAEDEPKGGGKPTKLYKVCEL
jgi:hypothetical protein